MGRKSHFQCPHMTFGIDPRRFPPVTFIAKLPQLLQWFLRCHRKGNGHSYPILDTRSFVRSFSLFQRFGNLFYFLQKFYFLKKSNFFRFFLDFRILKPFLTIFGFWRFGQCPCWDRFFKEMASLSVVFHPPRTEKKPVTMATTKSP